MTSHGTPPRSSSSAWASGAATSSGCVITAAPARTGPSPPSRRSSGDRRLGRPPRDGLPTGGRGAQGPPQSARLAAHGGLHGLGAALLGRAGVAPARAASYEHDGLVVEPRGVSLEALLAAANFDEELRVVVEAPPADPKATALELHPDLDWTPSNLSFDSAELLRPPDLPARALPQRGGGRQAQRGDGVLREGAGRARGGLGGRAARREDFEGVPAEPGPLDGDPAWAGQPQSHRPLCARSREDLCAPPPDVDRRLVAAPSPGCGALPFGLQQLLEQHRQRVLALPHGRRSTPRPAGEAAPPRVTGRRPGLRLPHHEAEQARREDCFSRYTPWTFEEPAWVGTEIEEFILGEDGIVPLLHRLDVACIEDAALQHFCGAAPWARRLKLLLEKVRGQDPFLDWLLDFACDNVDEALYFGKQNSRAVSAHPVYTECFALCGAARSGKDVWLSMVQKLCGTGPCHLVATMKWGQLMPKAGGSAEGCSPFLRAAAAARFLIFSEVPNRPLSMTLLKPLCEQRGAKIAARTLYEGAAEFTPTGLPILTSNFAPKLCIDEKSDTGAESRIRAWKTEAIYTEKPTLLTHKVSDADLQNRIEQGVMSPYMFFWLRQLYFLLNRDNHTRNIEPVPARIMEFTELCLRSGSDGRFQLWLQKVTGTLELAEASTASQVEKSAAGVHRGGSSRVDAGGVAADVAWVPQRAQDLQALLREAVRRGGDVRGGASRAGA